MHGELTDPREHRRRRPALGIGHSGRLRGDTTMRWLILGHLLVFGLALEDEAVVALIIESAALPPRLFLPIEVALNLGLFLAWGALTAGWIRVIHRIRRKGGGRR